VGVEIYSHELYYLQSKGDNNMTQLSNLKELLGTVPESDTILQWYLDDAGSIICRLRNSDIVETQYYSTQVKMAIELYNKRGAEGEVGHAENGIGRSYDGGDISKSLLSQIIPVATTPFSTVRVIPV
jgi:hypothetical protein